jgi:exosortase D (VPLPA-CTERM-specific)
MMLVRSPQQMPTGVVSRGVFALVALLVALAGFSDALLELVFRWHRQEEYSHGFLVPVVAAWLLWARRDAVLANIGRPAWSGSLLILIAAALHVISELSATFVLSQVGFILALLGIVLSVGGYSLLRVTFVPLIFLFFAIPLPYFVDSMLSLRLQLISSELGVFFINLFRIPVYLEGNIIDLGFYKLAVIEACSGLRYLYPLLCLGFLASYLFHAPFWQRAIVFLSSIPITIVMNGFRIGMVGVLVDRFGAQAADGVLHFFEGWVIFIACAVLLAAEIYVLASISGKGFFEAFYLPTGNMNATYKMNTGAISGLPVVAGLVLLCAAGFSGLIITHRPEIIPERSLFVSFPSRIDQWQGHISLMEPETEHGLGVDDYILSDYVAVDRKAVNLYVAYYSSQRQGSSPHSPAVCIPGGGWKITEFERTTYSDPATEFPVNRVVIEQGSTKEIVYYWFDERGKKIANEWWSKWQLLIDAIVMNRTDGALVRVMTQVFPGEPERAADERLQSFMRGLVPSLKGYLPSGTPINAQPVADQFESSRKS